MAGASIAPFYDATELRAAMRLARTARFDAPAAQDDGVATTKGNRIDKILQDANIKLSKRLVRHIRVSGQWMWDALLEGKATPEQIAQLA